MNLIPYPAYRWVADRVVGKFLVYGFKREMARGNIHEAQHIAAAVQAGNSQPCSEGKPCTLTQPMRVPAQTPNQQSRTTEGEQK